jgi:hypothetical protein
VNSFGNLLQTVALSPPDPVCDSREARRWFDWKEEIFADLCAIFSMGTWAISAMVELERASVRGMFVNRTSYPPSIVRLELMAQVGEALGLNGYTALGDLQPKAMIADKTLEEVADLHNAVSKDLQILPKMVAAMLGPLPVVGRFTEFYRWNINAAYFRAGGAVFRLAEQLLGTEKLYPDPTLASARLLISAALAAWSKVSIATQDASQRNQARERLAERLLPAVIESREVGVRATIPVAEPDITGLDVRLIDILFRDFPDQVE